MEVLESQSPSFIHRGSARHLYGDEGMIFQQHLAPAHKKGQDMATGAEHSSAPLARQHFRPKHYWKCVEQYEEMHKK